MATNGKSEGEDKAAQAQRSSAGRGASYPALGIKEAIDKARAFYNAERRNAAPAAAAARHWGYSEKSSSVRVVIAALIHYGLLEDSGSNEARTLKLTERGLDILLDAEDSPKRLAAIQAAVRTPKANAELFVRHAPDDLPSDQTLRFHLIREKGFNDGAVDGYIKSLRESIAYAKLDKPIMIPDGKTDPKVKKPEVEPPEVGDLIQWESSGVLRMEAPRRVRAKIEDQGAWWVFVEGSEAGIPMDETVVIERKADPAAQKQPPTLPLMGVAPRVEPVAGESEASRGKLGDGVSYRLLVTGELGGKEIGKLIRLLKAQKAVLDDPDDDNADD
jgi:hypothetical protein